MESTASGRLLLLQHNTQRLQTTYPFEKEQLVLYCMDYEVALSQPIRTTRSTGSTNEFMRSTVISGTAVQRSQGCRRDTTVRVLLACLCTSTALLGRTEGVDGVLPRSSHSRGGDGGGRGRGRSRQPRCIRLSRAQSTGTGTGRIIPHIDAHEAGVHSHGRREVCLGARVHGQPRSHLVRERVCGGGRGMRVPVVAHIRRLTGRPLLQLEVLPTELGQHVRRPWPDKEAVAALREAVHVVVRAVRDEEGVGAPGQPSDRLLVAAPLERLHSQRG